MVPCLSTHKLSTVRIVLDPRQPSYNVEAARLNNSVWWCIHAAYWSCHVPVNSPSHLTDVRKTNVKFESFLISSRLCETAKLFATYETTKRCYWTVFFGTFEEQVKSVGGKYYLRVIKWEFNAIESQQNIGILWIQSGRRFPRWWQVITV